MAQGGRPSLKFDMHKHWSTKMQPLLESFPGPLLKSGVGPLARYGNHQEIISRRLEQMYASSDIRLEWPREGHYSSRTQIKAKGPNGATIRLTS